MGVVLRFLASGDFQVHDWKQFSITLPNGMNSRLYNCLKVFDIVRREAKARGINKFLANGDLLEATDYISVEVYDGLYRKLERLHSEGVETAINLGNHDISSELRGRVLHSLRPFRKVARVLEKPSRIWNHLQVVPWMADPKRFKKTIARLDAGRNIVLALHCGVQGARTGPTAYLVRNPIKLRDIRANDFGLVLLSDYHTRQWLASNVLYMGSPLQHTFGEIHRPCIYEVQILSRPPWFHLEKIYTDLPRFRRVKAKNRRELRQKLGACRGDYVRIIIPTLAKLSDDEVESTVGSSCLYQIERQGEEVTDATHEHVHALEPREAIARYVGTHISSKTRRAKLIALGEKLYAGN
jgi:hypothetical protein